MQWVVGGQAVGGQGVLHALVHLDAPVGVVGKHVGEHRVVAVGAEGGHCAGIGLDQCLGRGLGGHEVFHGIHVVDAHLGIAVAGYRLVFPLQRVAVDRPVAVAGRAAVLAVVVGIVGVLQAAGPPPGGAYRCDVVLGDVAVRRVGSVVVVGVAAHEVHRLEVVEAGGQRGIIPAGAIGGKGAVEAELRDVKHHDDGRRLVGHQLQVLDEPAQLLVGHLVEIATAAGHASAACRARVGVENVVEHDVVHPAQVEGVVVGTHEGAPRLGGQQVGVVGERLHGAVVVVVAHDREQRYRVAVGHLVGHEVDQVVLVGIPVEVPGEVAQNGGVYLGAALLGGIFLPFQGGNPAVVVHRAVAVALGQVAVGAKYHDILVVVAAGEREVVGLGRGRVGALELLPELRVEAVGVGWLIAARHGVEHIAVFFLAREAVVAAGIGGGHDHAVAHGHARHARALAGDVAAHVESCRLKAHAGQGQHREPSVQNFICHVFSK